MPFPFLSHNPMQQGKALKVLEKSIQTGNGVMPIYQWLEGMERGLEVRRKVKVGSSRAALGYVLMNVIGDRFADTETEVLYYEYLEQGGAPYSVFLNEQKRLKEEQKNEARAKREIEEKQALEIHKKRFEETVTFFISHSLEEVFEKLLAGSKNLINELEKNPKSGTELTFRKEQLERNKKNIAEQYEKYRNVYFLRDGKVHKQHTYQAGDLVLVNDRGEVKNAQIESMRENGSGDFTYKLTGADFVNPYFGYESLLPRPIPVQSPVAAARSEPEEPSCGAGPDIEDPDQALPLNGADIPSLESLISQNALFVLNHSGGKDSQAMYLYLKERVPAGQIVVVHAHLPEVEWDGVIDHIKATISHELHVVQATKTFLEMVEHRQMWPSPSTRQCTSDLKRGPIEKRVRAILKDRPVKIVVNCMGLRAEESPMRKKKPVWRLNLGNSIAGRTWYEWLPIHHLTKEEVFELIRANGQQPHWAYAKGMSRLSCVFCIMASEADMRTAAELNPALHKRFVEIEERIGHTFRMPVKGERTWLREFLPPASPQHQTGSGTTPPGIIADPEPAETAVRPTAEAANATEPIAANSTGAAEVPQPTSTGHAFADWAIGKIQAYHQAELPNEDTRANLAGNWNALKADRGEIAADNMLRDILAAHMRHQPQWKKRRPFIYADMASLFEKETALATPAESAGVVLLSPKAKAEKQIKTLKLTLKYLVGEPLAKAEKQISGLKLAAKYLK